MTIINFGPQADAVQVILDTFLKLSIEERKQLVALRDEDFWSAWRMINDGVADRAGLSAAQSALRDRLFDGIHPTYSAILAVLLRHIIGTDGFEQAHYDALVKPWVTITGKWAHPHDVTPPIVEDNDIEAEVAPSVVDRDTLREAIQSTDPFGRLAEEDVDRIADAVVAVLNEGIR